MSLSFVVRRGEVDGSGPRRARLRMTSHGHRRPDHGNISGKGDHWVDSRSSGMGLCRNASRKEFHLEF